MLSASVRAGGLCVALVALAGCGQSISVDKTVSLDPLEVKGAALIDAPKGQQKIKVEFTSTESAVNVYIALGKESVADELLKATPKAEILAESKGKKSDTLVATIPAGKDYGVFIGGATKKTSVTVKIRGS